jgi:hypothetical protein
MKVGIPSLGVPFCLGRPLKCALHVQPPDDAFNNCRRCTYEGAGSMFNICFPPNLVCFFLECLGMSYEFSSSSRGNLGTISEKLTETCFQSSTGTPQHA